MRWTTKEGRHALFLGYVPVIFTSGDSGAVALKVR